MSFNWSDYTLKQLRSNSTHTFRQGGGSRPDVLLIERDYKYWCIGEVEISKHSFKGHIFPQLIEIYSLMEQNINLIRDNYLKLDTLNVDFGDVDSDAYYKKVQQNLKKADELYDFDIIEDRTKILKDIVKEITDEYEVARDEEHVYCFLYIKSHLLS